MHVVLGKQIQCNDEAFINISSNSEASASESLENLEQVVVIGELDTNDFKEVATTIPRSKGFNSFHGS